METDKILTANILDIVFEGRNKEYGAYALRKTYNNRLKTALGIIAIAVTILILIGAGTKKINETPRIIPPDMNVSAPNRVIEEEKIVLPKKLVKEKVIKTDAVTRPIIVTDKHVTEPPVAVEDITNARIDTKSTDGEIDEGIIPLAGIKGSLIFEEFKKEITEDEPFIPVEIEASFNGDWGLYVKKEIEKNIEELTEAGESGTWL